MDDSDSNADPNQENNLNEWYRSRHGLCEF